MTNVLKSSLFAVIIFISWSNNSSAQTITTFAGTGLATYGGDGGQATAAQLSNPTGIALDASGNVYISDYNNHRIRKVSPNGVISTFAGNGNGGYTGDGGLATNAELNLPSTLIFDAAGNAYIADHANSCIRKVSASGIITTIAGTGTAGYSGDGGPATSAQLSYPTGLVFDAQGNLFVADRSNNVVRKITPAGIITTFAGTGIAGFSGDGGPATNAQFADVNGIDFDAAGNLYIADKYNNRIRKVNTAGIVSTFAGTGVQGYGGDGGPAANANLNLPFGITFDQAGNAYIDDWNNMRIRKILPSGIISTYVGNGIAGFSGDGGLANNAQINYSEKVSFDKFGNLYVPDASNQRVRKITCPTPVTLNLIPASTVICKGQSTSITASGATNYTWSNGSHAAIINVTPTVTSTYTITGINADGCKNTAAVTITVNCTELNELVPEATFFSCFPNPTKTQLNIRCNKEVKMAGVRLIDMLGKVCYQAHGDVDTINVSLLEPGIYFLEVHGNNRQVALQKVVIGE